MIKPEQQGEFDLKSHNDLLVGARLLGRRPFDAILYGMCQQIHDGNGGNKFTNYLAITTDEGRDITIQRTAFDKPDTFFETKIHVGPEAHRGFGDIWASNIRKGIDMQDEFLGNYFSLNPGRNTLWSGFLCLEIRYVQKLQRSREALRNQVQPKWAN